MADELFQTTTEGDEAGQPQANEATAPEPEAQEGSNDQPTNELEEGGGEAPEPELVPKMELEERIKSVKGGYEGTIKKLKADLQQAQSEYQRMIEERERQEIQSFLHQVEEAGGDVDIAKQVATMKLEQARRARELAAREQEIAAERERLEAAARVVLANELIDQYGLGKEAKAELLKCSSATELREKALLIALEKTKAAQKPATKVDSGRDAGNSGIDIMSMPPSEALGTLIEMEERRKSG